MAHCKRSSIAVVRQIFRVLVVMLSFLSAPFLDAQQLMSKPVTEFVIGRRSFFDFGPPFDFYEIYLVRASEQGSSIDRITLTPPGDSCMQVATVETASASLSDSIEMLLGGKNPCAISEKDLRRELKRCKKCLVFSGAVTNMQLQCGGQTRMIRSQVLDRDMFDTKPRTPRNTLWTTQLLTNLDKAVGSNVTDKPAFGISPMTPALPAAQSPALQDVSMGKYDSLFQGAPDRPSDLYKASQLAFPKPDIDIRINTPIPTGAWVERTGPIYPPIARVARVEGRVILKFRVGPDGSTSNLIIESGHPLLLGASEKAVASWKFSQDLINQDIEATIEFRTNCSNPKK
jgi:TonB family protein